MAEHLGPAELAEILHRVARAGGVSADAETIPFIPGDSDQSQTCSELRKRFGGGRKQEKLVSFFQFMSRSEGSGQRSPDPKPLKDVVDQNHLLRPLDTDNISAF